jgi:hypothetical protein
MKTLISKGLVVKSSCPAKYGFLLSMSSFIVLLVLHVNLFSLDLLCYLSYIIIIIIKN